jgi:hypothetical protein
MPPALVPSLLLPGEIRPWTMSATFNFLRCIVAKPAPDKNDIFQFEIEDVGVRFANSFTRDRFLEIARTECIALDVDALVRVKRTDDGMGTVPHDMVPLVSTDTYLCLKFVTWLSESGKLSEKQETDISKTELAAVFLAWVRKNVFKIGMSANVTPTCRILSKVVTSWFGFETCKSRVFGNKKLFECFRVPSAENLRKILSKMRANASRGAPQCGQAVRKRNVEAGVRALADVIKGLVWRNSNKLYIVPFKDSYIIDIKAIFEDFGRDRFAPYIWKTEAAMKKVALKMNGCVDSKIKKPTRGIQLPRWRNPRVQRHVMDALLKT